MTCGREIPLERLLGRRVVDADGRALGRIEEVHAERRDGELVVLEWVLGTGGLVERLGLLPMARALFGWPAPRAPEVLDWTELDLSDLDKPRRRSTVMSGHRPSRPAAHR
jgi:PRC-barrel domain